MDFGDVLWQYQAPANLPFPFADQVQVKQLDEKHWATCKKDSDGAVYGMVLYKSDYWVQLWLADGDHKKKLGIEFYLDNDGDVYWEDKSSGEKVRFNYRDTKSLDVVTPFKGDKRGKKLQKRVNF